MDGTTGGKMTKDIIESTLSKYREMRKDCFETLKDMDTIDRADLWVYASIKLRQFLDKELLPIECECMLMLLNSHWNDSLLARKVYSIKSRQLWCPRFPSSPIVELTREYFCHVIADCRPIPTVNFTTPRWFNNLRGSTLIF